MVYGSDNCVGELTAGIGEVMPCFCEFLDCHNLCLKLPDFVFVHFGFTFSVQFFKFRFMISVLESSHMMR